VRALTIDEIKQSGYAQIADGGPTALSLNGIAKTMGMSGPAMYRYFASRDELLAILVTESYEHLAEALTDAALNAHRQAPAGRLRAVAHAFREWALASPHRYRLVFASTYGSGDLDPTRIIPAANRSMAVILSAVGNLAPDPPPPPDDTLGRQLDEWGGHSAFDPPYETGELLLGLLAWTRLHGIISLEIEGFFTQLGIDPALIYDAEIDQLICQGVTSRRPAGTADLPSPTPGP
jgi:AcrR family transcriptional regulator